MSSNRGLFKQCSICEEEVHLHEFSVDNSRDDGKGRVCKRCRRLYDKIKRRCKREYVNHYTSLHPCVDCGDTRPTVLEFDHIKDKDVNISVLVANGSSWKKLQREIDKCEVRCASCHSHRHRKDLDHYHLEEL